MPPGVGYNTPFVAGGGWGQPGEPIMLPDGSQIFVPAGGLSQAEYDVLSGVRAGNQIGGPFAQQVLDSLIGRGIFMPGGPGDAPQSMTANEPRIPGVGGGDSPQVTMAGGGQQSQAGGPPPPMPRPGASGGNAPVYRQPSVTFPGGQMPAPAYASSLAQRLAAQRQTRLGRYNAPTPTSPPPMSPNQNPPPGAGGPRPRGPNGVDINGPKGGSPPFYPPGGGVPDSQLPTGGGQNPRPRGGGGSPPWYPNG